MSEKQSNQYTSGFNENFKDNVNHSQTMTQKIRINLSDLNILGSLSVSLFASMSLLSDLFETERRIRASTTSLSSSSELSSGSDLHTTKIKNRFRGNKVIKNKQMMRKENEYTVDLMCLTGDSEHQYFQTPLPNGV